MAFCPQCGSTLTEEQKFCPSCGHSLQGAPAPVAAAVNPTAGPVVAREENGTAIFLLGLFLGGWGVHQFMARNTSRGLVYLLCSTIGAFLVIPPFVIFILVLIDLFKIAKGDFYSVDRTVHYQGAKWMKILSIVFVVIIPLIFVLGIVAAIAVPKFMGMSAKAKAAEVGPAAGSFSKLMAAYAVETGTLGSWEQIGYVPPGASTAVSESQTTNFSYTDLNPGLVATNIVDLGECAAGNKWVAIPEPEVNESGSVVDVKFAFTPPEEEACANLTPNFAAMQ